MPKEWSRKEEEFLKQKYRELTNPELAAALKVSVKSIEAKLRRLKFSRKRPGGRKARVGVELAPPEVKPAQDKNRAKAIQEFDKALTLWMAGKESEAIAQFKLICTEYASVLDVALVASSYVERCRVLEKGGGTKRVEG